MFDNNDENYIYDIVGKNLKHYRTLANMTQEQFSAICNYHKQFISNLESPKTHQTVSLGTLHTFAKVLNIPTYYLLRDDERK